MKIKKSELKYLIENFLHEIDDDKTDPGERTDPGEGSFFDPDKTEPDIHGSYLKQQHGIDHAGAAEERIAKNVSNYRYPEQPPGLLPNFSFGDEEGVNYSTRGKNIPGTQTLSDVHPYIEDEIGGPMPSVDDQEITIPSIEVEEKTEEAPYGTVASNADTEEIYRYQGDQEKEDEGLLQRIKNKFIELQKKYF